MNGLTILYLVAGLAGFGVGAYLAASGERQVGIALMGLGLIFQVLTLRQLKLAKQKGGSDAR